MITVRNISKSYKSNVVLDNVSLDIKKGKCIYIHGINGSGKSTLFKIICGIIKSDKGEIIKDKGIYIGALIENPGFIEEENIKYNLKFLASINHHYNEDKVRELCRKFSLNYDNKEAIKNYSLGMRQKTGIIQSIMENQDLILLDEPTRGLDRESIKAFVLLVNKLMEEDKTVIIASHDYLEDIHFTDQYTLSNGHLIKDETL